VTTESIVTVVGTVEDLPTSAMGPRSLLWWGTFGFMLIEGTVFLLAAAAYLYLRGQTGAWPPSGDRPPDLLYGSMFTVLAALSLLPNLWTARMAKQKRALEARWGVFAMTLIAIGLTVVRGYEFTRLNVRWDQDAYGSLTWLMMVLHASHLITDLGDTAVLGAWLFTHQCGDDQFSDINDNAGYWNFVVLSWLPIYLLVYWGPRWL
jgi:heme/copper-type cytochrome/quinol oxidase subunit 3